MASLRPVVSRSGVLLGHFGSRVFCQRACRVDQLRYRVLAGVAVFSGVVAASRFKREKTGSPVVLIFDGRRDLSRYPEIKRRVSDSVAGGRASLEGSFSKQAFGQQYAEVDRILMSLHCMRLIVGGSDAAYDRFVRAQDRSQRLTEQSFGALHALAQAVLNSKCHGLQRQQVLEVVEAALVLDGIKDMQQSPTFTCLSEGQRALLLQFIEEDDRVNNFSLFVRICRVAGSAGEMNNDSSVAYTEAVHRELFKVAQ